MRISDWSSDVCSSDLPTLRFRNVEPTPPPPSRPPPGHGHGHRGHGYGYGGGGYWVRDECHAMPQREVCARLRDRRQQIRQTRFNAQANDRATPLVEERGSNARLPKDCGGADRDSEVKGKRWTEGWKRVGAGP